MSLKQEECIVTDEALDAVIKKFEDTTGIRDLEQAAEHIAANALYQIEVDHVKAVTFTPRWYRSFWTDKGICFAMIKMLPEIFSEAFLAEGMHLFMPGLSDRKGKL